MATSQPASAAVATMEPTISPSISTTYGAGPNRHRLLGKTVVTRTMRELAVLAVVGCYSSSPRPPTPPAKPAHAPHVRAAADPLGFLPIDAELVAQLDVGALRRTTLWARFEPALLAKAGPTLEQFRLACAFDPLPQIEHVAIGIRYLGTPQPDGVLVIRGIARAQLMRCMDKVVASQPTLATLDRGVVLLRPDPGEKPVAFAFADARTLVIFAGEHAATAQGLRDVLSSGAALRTSEAFMEMFGRIDGKRIAWFFLNGTSKIFDAVATFGFHPHAFYGSLDATVGATAKLFVRMPTAAEATNLVTTIQGQITAVQALVERFEVSTDDLDVVIDVALTEDQLALGANLLGP